MKGCIIPLICTIIAANAGYTSKYVGELQLIVFFCRSAYLIMPTERSILHST